MTKPRDPREWDDTMFEIERINESLNESLSEIRADVEATRAGLREVARILGAPEPRPKLQIVKGGDDG